MDEIEPKFGEWLRGTYASESNPHRDGMYVRTIHRKGRMNPGKFYELTDGNGAFWMYPAQSVERIAAAKFIAQASREYPACDRCDSPNVSADAAARWDHAKQDWMVTNVFDKGHSCDDCGDECRIKWVKGDPPKEEENGS